MSQEEIKPCPLCNRRKQTYIGYIIPGEKIIRDMSSIYGQLIIPEILCMKSKSKGYTQKVRITMEDL